MGWFRETPEEKAARHAKYGPRAEASRAKVERRFKGSEQAREMKAYVRDRRADELFSFGDVHVLTDCIVRTSDDEAGVYPLAGGTARIDEQGDLSSHGTLGRSLVAPGWQKTINTIATRMIIDGPNFQWIVPFPVTAGDPYGKAARLTTLGRTSAT